MKFCILLLAALLPLTANALTIKNFTDEEHRVVVEYGGSDEIVTIPAHGIRKIGGVPSRLRMGKQLRPFLTPTDEWVIWSSTNLHLQRRPEHYGRHP